MSTTPATEAISGDYSLLRSALGSIQRDFQHGASLFPNLYYESITSPAGALSQQAWEGFIAANEKNNEWERWEIDSDGTSCTRYYGNQEWFEHFRRLGESGFLILREIQWLFGKHQDTPPNCQLDLPSYDGHPAWVHILEASAQLSTPTLRLVGRVWNLPYDHEGETEQLMLESWEAPDNGRDRFPRHPFCVSLHQNLFCSSAEAIRLWLQTDEEIVQLGDVYDDEAIRLPPADQITWGQSLPESSASDTQAVIPHFEAPELDIARPQYGTLTFAGKIVKAFNQEAEHQAAILTAFQDAQWARRIASPLHKEGMGHLEKQAADHALRQALATLRKGTKEYLLFKADRGFIEWQPAPTIPAERSLFNESDQD